MALCEYKHIFGEENTGIHSVRVLNVAVVDLLMTLLVGCYISYYSKVNLYLIWSILLVFGILVHRLFCVNSTINKLIFGKV